ncbi:MAG TPA: hypothetical protein VGR16_00290 [Thermomicrobiales bacterium]|nr:hypothetical protein [Thermomicrobiales bacterium]
MTDQGTDGNNEHQAQDHASLAVTDTSSEAAEIARLRERLTFYESFDRLIQENIARSGDLMREAVELRERTHAELARAREELEQSRRQAEEQLQAERQSQRGIFASLVEELSAVQESAQRLTRRVSEAVSQIGDAPPRLAGGASALSAPETPATPHGDASGLSTADPFHAADESEMIAGTQDEPTDSATFGLLPDEIRGNQESIDDRLSGASDGNVPIALPTAEASGAPEAEVAPYGDAGETERVSTGDTPRDEDVIPFTWSDDMETGDTDEPDQSAGLTTLEDEASLFTGSQVHAEDEAANVEAISPTSEGLDETASYVAPGEEARTDEGQPDTSRSEPRAITVLVHGVPRAATALSLQRHLAGLDHVAAVEAREYAEGVLRLQVTSTRPLAFDDLVRWEDGQGLEPVHVHADIIEVRLPGGDF